MPNPDENNRADYSFKPGDIVGGNYRIINFIGKGAMGKVYRAQHEMMPREYALKTLNENQVTEESWRRFQVEAQSIARMSHPNVVVIYNLGIHNGFLPYYVMDLLNGESLFDRLNRVEVLSVQDAIPIFTQVCDGLGYAHKKGIVHRDIKPDNIFLLKEPEPGGISVKIVDFGIAKLSDAKDPKNQQLTKVGEVFGTPFYMSPEQCMGLRVDGRSDIYSLGCALFETLTGTPPFRGINSMETMMMHQNDAPPSLEKASHGSKFPESIEILIAKTLAKEPMDRYQSMEQLKQDLNKILEGKDLSVLPYLNLNENRQAGVNETLRLTGKSENITGRQGHSKDRETMFVDPTGPQDKLRSTASGAYIDRGESASTARITRPYGTSDMQGQDDTGSQGETGRRQANRSLNIFITLAAIFTIACGGACAYFILMPPTGKTVANTATKMPAVNVTSIPLDTSLKKNIDQFEDMDNFDGGAEIPASAPKSISDKGFYSSIKMQNGQKTRCFKFPKDFALGAISEFDNNIKGYKSIPIKARDTKSFPAQTKLLFLPSIALTKYPEYLERFQPGDFESVSLRFAGTDEMVLVASKVPGLKELRLFNSKGYTQKACDTICKMKNLESLYIERCKIRGDQLTGIKTLPKLEAVVFSYADGAGALIESLKQNPRLKILNLEESQISPKDFLNITSIHSLKYLNLVGTDLSKCNMRSLSSLNNLEQLNIKSPHLPANTADCLARLPNLRVLNAGSSKDEIDLLNKIKELKPGIKTGTTDIHL